MRKMQRSQSSYRHYRTVMEADSDQWGDQSRGIDSHHQHSLCLVPPDHPNKENNSFFQSVSERQLEPKSNEQVWRDRCRHYEQQIRQLHEDRDHSKVYYDSQIEDLRAQLVHGSRDDGQLSSVSRDGRQNHALVKEINSKQIQITHLKERLECQKGELDTLRLYLSEKEAEIKEWEEKSQQVQKRRQRLDQYQAMNTEYQEQLKDLERSLQHLKTDNTQKQKAIADKGAVIQQQLAMIQSYEEKLTVIEQALIGLKRNKKEQEEKIDVLQQEREHWKRAYEEAMEKQKRAEEWEVQVKAYAGMVSDLNEKKSLLVGQLDEMKIKLGKMESQTSRSAHLEKELAAMQQKYNQAQQSLIHLQEQVEQQQHLAHAIESLQLDKHQSQQALKQAHQQLKKTAVTLQQVQAKLAALEEENAQLKHADGRGRQRSEKIDTLMRENSKLNATLLKKVDQIEKLRQKINKLEMDLGSEKSESMKIKGQMDILKQDIRQQTLQIDSIRQRLQAETSTRIGVQEELLRQQQDSSALNFNLEKAEEDKNALQEQLEQIQAAKKEEISSLKASLLQMEQSRSQSESLLKTAKQQIDKLRDELQELKVQVEESHQNELRHKSGVVMLQEKLTEILSEKRQLQEKVVNMAGSAAQIRQLSEGIIRMGNNLQ